MIHRLVPTFILENDAAGRRHGSFAAVGLFVDISGFSDLTDVLMNHGQHGAEVLAGVMRAVLAPLIQAVFEQGGFIAHQAGDAFTALFPLETLEQAPTRALAAAWKIQQHTAAQPTYVTPYGAFAISAKAGLAMGQTAWGIVASVAGRRAAYYFQGSTIDGCANAEHTARPGEIVLDRALYDRVQDRLTATPTGDFFRLQTLTGALPNSVAVTSPPIDLEQVARFYPRELWLDKRSGEFRQVAILFVSLPTVRTETQLELFMQTVFTLQDRYGGLLTGLDFGDKGANLLIVWGAPTAYENDVDRALSFVLELQSQTEIPINGGITYRIAHAGFVGGDLAEEYAPFGRGVNLAARFMTHAPRGEIWLDAPAAQKAQARYTLEPRSEQPFKGFALPQMVYVLLERQETAVLTFGGPWVGREDELTTLMTFARQVFSGQGARALVVWGEPGIGKSRLVHQFLADLRQQQPGFLLGWAQTDEILRGSLNPFSYWLRSYFGITAAAPEARNKRSFNRKLDDLIATIQSAHLANELDRTRSFLGAAVGLRWPDSLFEQVDTQARHENTLIGLATLMQAESTRQPVLLVLEDAHWLDDDSKAFLPRLLRTLMADEARPYPVALLITARFEGAGLPLADFVHTDLFLRALSREMVAAQAQAHLGAPASAQLLDLLEHDGQGNPFFTEQIIAYLREEARLELANGLWQVPAVGRVLLPSDVNAVLVARLDRLTREVLEVVQTAAVLGREFEVRLLVAMLRGEPAVLDRLVQAERQDIWSALNAVQHIFRHGLLRDAAYQMQAHGRRQALHAVAATALEELYAADLRPHYGELAYHAEQAGLADTARRYLHLAGTMAADAYQNSLAVDYFSRALALTPENAALKRFQLLAAREAVYALQARQPERAEDLAVLAALAGEMAEAGHRVEVAVRQADFAAAQGDYSRAAQLADAAVALAREAGLTQEPVAAYFSAADAYRKQGDYEAARPRAEAGLALARSLSLSHSEASLLNLLGLIVLDQKDAPQATDYFQASLAIYRQLGDRRGQAMPLNNLGNISGFQGDYAMAQSYFDQALAIAREIGHRAGESLLLNNLGWIAGAQGDLRRAKAYAEQNLRIAREIGDRLSETYGLINLSAQDCEIGDYQAAANSARRALEMSRADHDRSAEAWALTNLGHSLAGGDDVTGAVEAYQSALAIRVDLGQPVLVTEPRAGLARMALAQGATGRALELVEALLPVLGDGNPLEGADEPLRVYLSCFQVLQAAGDKRAWAILETGHGLLQARAGALPDEAARQSYLHNVACHREIMQAWQRHLASEPN